MLASDWIASVAYDVSAFGAVCSAVLADVQERFVYRAHTYVRDEILNYRPAPGDLAYPHKLLMMQVTRPDPDPICFSLLCRTPFTCAPLSRYRIVYTLVSPVKYISEYIQFSTLYSYSRSPSAFRPSSWSARGGSSSSSSNSSRTRRLSRWRPLPLQPPPTCLCSSTFGTTQWRRSAPFNRIRRIALLIRVAPVRSLPVHCMFLEPRVHRTTILNLRSTASD